MGKMLIYDPAMCCSTGVCGSSVDPELLRVAAVIENLKKAGVDVQRYNLSKEPKEFMINKDVNNALSERGMKVLPITVVDSKVVKSGSYPTNEEFSKWSGAPLEQIKPATKVKVNKCGCGPKGCC